jgi:hypothetical protein
MVQDGAPCVCLEVGETELQLTATQAEEVAESLARAATAARYEAGIDQVIKYCIEEGYLEIIGSKDFLSMVRERIENKRVAQN